MRVYQNTSNLEERISLNSPCSSMCSTLSVLKSPISTVSDCLVTTFSLFATILFLLTILEIYGIGSATTTFSTISSTVCFVDGFSKGTLLFAVNFERAFFNLSSYASASACLLANSSATLFASNALISSLTELS